MRATHLILPCSLLWMLLAAGGAAADESETVVAGDGQAASDDTAGQAKATEAKSAGDEVDAESAESAAPAEDPGDARARASMHFKMGVDFYRERNFAAALVEFKRAYEVAPHFKLKFNLGQTAFELQDYSYAIDNLTAYLEEGEEDVPADRRKVVEEMIDTLHSRLAFVTIESNEDGARVYVDDRLIGETPFARPVPIGAGRRRIVALKQGFVTVEQRVDLAARDELDLELHFDPPPEAEQVVVTRVVSEDLHPAVWVGIGAGVAGAGAITLAILTAITKQQYEDELKQETTSDRLEELRDRVKTRALMTDIAIGITGAALVAALSTLLIEPEEEKAEDPSIVPGVDLDSTQATLWISGKF